MGVGSFGPSDQRPVAGSYPAVGGWVARAPMPTARSGGAKAVIDGKIYVAGGRPPGGSAFEVYDPATDKWEKLPDLPIAVHGLKGSAVIGGRIFLPGGGITLGGNSGTNAMQVYRPTMRCE